MNSELKNRFVYLNPTQANQKVHINPHFQASSKVYLNPNFTPKQSIYVNPNVKPTEIHINPNKIHVNPNILKTINSNKVDNKNSDKCERKTLVSTRTKLVRAPVGSKQSKPKRRGSIRSKFKIVRSGRGNSSEKSWFKVDNRKVLNNSSQNSVKQRKKYVYNKVSSKKIVNISGILYKTSPNTLKKAVITPSKKYIVRNKTIRKKINKKHNIFLRKLKKCNIPCPFYRKYGYCRGKLNAKCTRKHDPAQIALCTKFLQGACQNENCLLSHNVSKEKMPTCKYYLEGLCSKENCQYLHVKISPKADICVHFIEGFCQKGSECDKRHQFLCPEYEKYGKCLKQRCAYPHGKMVRKYEINFDRRNVKKSEVKVEKTRYYVEKGKESSEVCENIIGIRAKRKIEVLPNFIPFENS